jgi:preprotein translocase subunit SecD
VAPDSEQDEARIKEVEEAEKKTSAGTSEYIARPVLREKPNEWGNLRTVLENGPGHVVVGSDLTRADVIYDDRGKLAVAFTFNPEGAVKLAVLTGNNIGRKLAILLDDRIVEEARIQSKINEMGQLTGDFSPEEARGIATVLESGALPGKLKLVSRTDPTGPGGRP